MKYLILGLVLIGCGPSDEELEFMKACTKDHKEYECKLMWRGSEPCVQTPAINQTYVNPAPVIRK